MPALAARQALVALLILAAALAAAGIRPQVAAARGLPPITALTARTEWRVVEASPQDRWGMPSRQWRLRDGAGQEALLYLGVTAQVQTMLRWSGELGYLGEGYVEVGRRDVVVPLSPAGSAPATEVTLRHLAQRRTIRYAVVGPHGIGRQGRDLAAGAAWDLARGVAAGYYLVRVSVDTGPGAGDLAAGLLAAVLADLARRTAAGTG